MSIATENLAPTLIRHLAQHGIAYDIVHHHHADSSVNVAQSAHIPAEKMVKAVILRDEDGYVMALVSGDHHVKIHNVNKKLHRNLALAMEDELQELFADCETGAIPPVGEAYGLPVVFDEDLEDLEDVFIEAGTHSDLLHLEGDDFRKLMKQARHGQISIH